MFSKHNRKNIKGQALVEAALITPLIVFFLFTLVWFARIMLTWQQIIGAARYGTDLIAYTNFSKSSIENYVISYLCDKNNIGRTLDPDKLTVEAKIQNQPKIDFSISFSSLLNFNPQNIIDTLIAVSPAAPMSSVTVTYKYRTPLVLRAAGREYIEIKAVSEVLNGSGSAGEKKRLQ